MISFMQEYIFEINLRNILNNKLIKFGSLSFFCYSFCEIIYEIIFIVKDIHDENIMERFCLMSNWIEVLLGTAQILLIGGHLNKITRLIKYDFRKTPYKKDHRKINYIKKRNSFYCLLLMGATAISAISFFPFNRKNDDGYMHLMKNFPSKIFEWIPYGYYLGWIFYVNASFVVGIFLASFTYLMIYFETVISSEVIILNEDLTNISRGYEYLDFMTMPKSLWYQKIVYKRLRRCVIRHSKVLIFWSEINKIFRYWLPLYMANSIIFCIFMFYYIFKDIKAQIESRITVMLTLVIAASIDAIIGQHIMDRMASVEVALYQTPWFCWNTKNRKLMCLFLLNAQKKIALNAVGVFDVNLGFLIWILRTMYSCIMLLRQLKV